MLSVFVYGTLPCSQQVFGYWLPPDPSVYS